MSRGLIAGGECTAIDAQPASLTDRLESERDQLEDRLAEIKGVLARLEQAPETRELLDAVARLGHFGY